MRIIKELKRNLEDIWEDICYRFRCIFVYPFQRMKRGYSDKDLWNLDYYLGNLIASSLEDFKKQTYGVPMDFDNSEDWDKVLDDMIFAFKRSTLDFFDLEEAEKDLSDEEVQENNQRQEKGFEYFNLYFSDLWW